MKKNKNFILILALLIGAFSMTFNSCTDELVKTDYDYKPDKTLTLSTLQLDSVVKASDEGISLYASINDVGQSELYDQGFVFSEDQSLTTFSTISVAPDTVGTVLKLIEKNHKINQGKTYYFKAFVLTKDGIVFSEKVTSILLPVTWEKVGSVNFTDNTFSGDTYEVELQKFSGRNEYRLVDPFDTGKDQYLRFFLSDTWDAAGVPNGTQPGSPPYSFYWHSNYVGDYCNFTNDANVYSMEFLLLDSRDNKLYLGGDVKFEWIDGYPGDIPAPVEPIATSYKTDFKSDAGRAGWILDRFSGFEKTDDVWYFDLAEAGASSWGGSIAAYYNDTPLKIISPAITVAENDTLSFGLYAGLFGSTENAKVKLYIRETGAAIDYSAPIKNWDLAKGAGKTSIPLTSYVGKEIKVIFVVEQGDFLFYHFAVAASDDASLIFR